MDIAVGQQAGWRLFERLHVEARTTGIPVLVISTALSTMERAQDQTARYGNHRYLAKPASFDEMLAQIREMVRGASPSTL
jgi:DNA-binding response OmpR family regulator